MTSLPLELYQVLEDEYVSMYGPLDRPPSIYAAADILDLRWARSILEECGLPVAADAATLAAQLSELVTGQGSLSALAKSQALTNRGKKLLAQYGELSGDLAEADDELAWGLPELRRTIVDTAFKGAVKPLCDVRLDNVYAALHKRADEGKPRTALCISGGGIRSATFALGVMQGLASANVLDQFDFLSTVSGGGYIGSWLSSWIRRHPRGATGVKEDLRRADTAVTTYQPTQTGSQTPTQRELPKRKIAPEPAPLRHLREYSSYLSPRLGILSGDSWTIASLYLRNLLLNLLVLVPLLAFGLSFPRIFSCILEWSKQLEGRHLPPQAWAWLAAGFLAIGFAYLGQQRPVDQGQRKVSILATDGLFILACVFPLALAATALAVFWARVNAHADQHLLKEHSTWWAAGGALAAMTVLPVLLYYGRLLTTLAAAQRKAFAAGRAARWVANGKKLGVETFAACVALVTTAVLLWLLAVKVFYDPLRAVPIAETMAPILRAWEPTSPQAQLYVCFVVPLLLLVFFVQASIFVGLSSFVSEDYDREWWGRAGAWLLAIAVGLGLLNAIAVFGPIGFYYAPVIVASLGGGAGLASALLGFSGSTPPGQKEKDEAGPMAKAGNLASVLTVPLFLVALLAAISLGSTWIIQELQDNPPANQSSQDGSVIVIPHRDKNDTTPIQPDQYAQAALLQSRFSQAEKAPLAGLTLTTKPAPRVSLPALRAIAHLQTIQQTSAAQVGIFLAVAAAGFGLSFCIGVNKFSMNALYRNRIIRAYLGASRYNREPDRFTGFDENDNLKMWELRPEILWSASLKDVDGFVNVALKGGQNKLGALLWDELDESTTDALEKKIDAVSTQALVDNLNALLASRDLAAKLAEAGIQPPSWAVAGPGKIGYPRTLVHRAILDDQLEDWLIPMTPPADAPGVPASALRRGPLHVVNTALNLTSGENLAWQQRMAESFTVSPYHSGSLFLGYRESWEYAGGISLGTAVAISGAAASPNMGYHSSPVMAFLLTFFNIRLGAWLGNTGPRGQGSYHRKHPRTGLVPLCSELTGNSTDTSKWVYLSDGGHFENLALYEMVLRRCHCIVLSDGGCDPDYAFEDLGNAIRKIRTDLGIPIDIAKIAMAKRAADGKPVTGEYVAIGTIRYSAVDKKAEDGQLIYIKPGVYQGDFFPWDVYNYAQESLEFPHEPTSDQFFSESQFESYRALGRHAVNEICKNYPLAGGSGAQTLTKTYDSVCELTSSVAKSYSK